MTKYINHNNLLPIEPIGPSQEKAFKAYEDDKNLFLSGAAGTGKTFILLYLAFKSVFNKETPYDKVVLIRSLLPSRDAGFHTGSLEEKAILYQAPYRMLEQRRIQFVMGYARRSRVCRVSNYKFSKRTNF